MFGRFRTLVFVTVAFGFLFPGVGLSARIKDITSIKGIRTNQLFGYGLIVGLNGSGDKGGTSFTIQSLASSLEKMGIHVSAGDVKVNNVAAVMVSGTLPPFARIGKKLDVTVSSIGDAKSLQGGTLLLTPLRGVDGKVYALAQGPISVGGFVAGGRAGGGVTKNHPTVGKISGGATIEREVVATLRGKRKFTLVLNNPDFVTATRICDAIDSRFGEAISTAIDSGTLSIRVPEALQDRLVQMHAQLGNLVVTPDVVAKVIVNEKTGTVVIGENVSISKVAVAHGNLSIEIEERSDVSQPPPFGTAPAGDAGAPVGTEGGAIVAPGGATVVVPESSVKVQEEKAQLVVFQGGRTVGDLVRALNAIGVTPRDLITILQSMKAAGALQAELQVM